MRAAASCSPMKVLGVLGEERLGMALDRLPSYSSLQSCHKICFSSSDPSTDDGKRISILALAIFKRKRLSGKAPRVVDNVDCGQNLLCGRTGDDPASSAGSRSPPEGEQFEGAGMVGRRPRSKSLSRVGRSSSKPHRVDSKDKKPGQARCKCKGTSCSPKAVS